MVGALLLRGLMAGLIAGLIGFGFAELAGEPLVGQAVVLEATAAAQRGEAPEPVLVSRQVQSGWGLFTGIMVYATALGGLFSLAFAFAWGRLAWNDARILAAMLAVGALLAIAYCPALKYPPNPPSIGRPETIRLRTALYFAMLSWSLLSAIAAMMAARALRQSLGPWNALVSGLLVFTILAATMAWLLPDIDEVPAAFPATLLWHFRMAGLGVQTVLWLSLGVVFGWLVNNYFRAAEEFRKKGA
jgi:hypothetical protein